MWTHLDTATAIRRWKSNDRAIKADDREIMANDREIRRRMESPIFIGRFSFNEIVDRVVGHDSIGFASSDGADFIMEQTADDRRAEIPLKTDVLLLF